MSPCVFKRLAGHILKKRRLDNSASGLFEWSQQSWVLGLACLLVSSLLSLKGCCFKSRWSHSFCRRQVEPAKRFKCVRWFTRSQRPCIGWTFWDRCEDPSFLRIPIRLVFQHRPRHHGDLTGQGDCRLLLASFLAAVDAFIGFS
jgi:hypothetical protein